jgi:hypothetical protein
VSTCAGEGRCRPAAWYREPLDCRLVPVERQGRPPCVQSHQDAPMKTGGPCEGTGGSLYRRKASCAGMVGEGLQRPPAVKSRAHTQEGLACT